jgi:hypothetical protein
MEDPRRRLASPGTNIEDRLEAGLTRGPRIEPAPDLEREEDLQAYRDVVHRSGQIPRVPHRRQRSGAVPDRAPASGRAAHLQRLPTRHADAAVLGRPAGAQPATLHITADAEIPDGGPRAYCCAIAATPAAGRFTSRTASCVTHTAMLAARPTRFVRQTRFPPASIGCGSSSSPPASRTSRRARALQAGRNCMSMASSSPKPRSRSPPPSHSTPAGSPAARLGMHRRLAPAIGLV